jgi:dolichyl-phosphate beta-glucosyltransferase
LRLSVIIPCFNEEKRITPTLNQVEAFFLSKGYPVEIIAVDDGSQDGTLKALEEFSRRATLPVKIISYQPNQGKGHAVRQGVLAAQGDFILFTDADLSTPLEEIDGFFSVFERDEAEVVIGSRNLPQSQVQRPKGREIMSKGFNFLVRALVLPGIKDTQCGFKCFSRAAALAIFAKAPTSGLAFDVEVLYIALRLGYRIVEVPVRWNYFTGSKVHPLRDSLRMFAALLRLRLDSLLGKYRDRGGY